jgi:very-short-patch-repair endonuclease
MTRSSYDRIASRQLGLVTLAQLRELGWSRAQVRHAVKTGQLDLIRPTVLRAAGSRRTQEQAWLAAALAAPGSVLSHATADRIWGMLFFPAPTAIDLLRMSSRPRLPGVRGHETDHLPPEHTSMRHALPVTSPARSLIDSCSLVSEKQLRSAANDAVRRKILILPTLVRTVDEVPVSGRRAIVPVVDYLKTKVPGYDEGDSDPELDLVETLVSAGFERPQQQVRVDTSIGARFVDVGWSEQRVGFEYDSVEFHVERFHEDRDRLRALKRAGWDIWPITSTTSRNEVLAIASLAFRHQRAA